MKIILVLAFVAVSVLGRPTLPEDGKRNCDLNCPDVYKPICAGDSSGDCFKMKTFNNECLMKSYNCRENADFQILYEGECKPICDN